MSQLDILFWTDPPEPAPQPAAAPETTPAPEPVSRLTVEQATELFRRCRLPYQGDLDHPSVEDTGSRIYITAGNRVLELHGEGKAEYYRVFGNREEPLGMNIFEVTDYLRSINFSFTTDD